MMPTQVVSVQAGSRRPSLLQGAPARLFVVETSHQGWFASQYAGALSYLSIDLHQGLAIGDIPAWLEATSPMAVVALMTAPPDVAALLAAVAEHDPGLPTLLVAPGSFGAGIDHAREGHGLRGLRHHPGDPGMHAIVEFLFAAGRRANCVHFMPA